ncbi:Ig-like domain-containing protein [Roseateles sp. NT4]|uniref:Ig-like domain-containing protein n=1 Tax=Roseateles sp. NT4 TaxID=3453715 RepID=UPI003EE827E0
MSNEFGRRDGALFRHALGAALISTLAACGGGGSDAPAPAPAPSPAPAPAPAAVAAADAYTVAWNAGTALGVTDNDTVSNGSASVAVDSAPAHGTATVDGSKITYTPSPGFFGSDSFSYKLSVGTASQSATVKVTVEAALTLQGQVTDAPVANATVKADVGAQSFTATADANGRYTIAVRSSQPGDFVTLTATGAGTQSKVVLTSLPGEIGGLAAAAKDGKLAAEQNAALNLTHLSAAQAGLIAQAGAQPKTNAELTAALERLGPQTVLDVAATAKLVIDGGVALPAGVADTRALLNSATALNGLRNSLRRDKAVDFEAARQATLGDTALNAPPPSPAASGAPVTLIYSYGDEAGSQAVRTLTLRADGTGTDVTDRPRAVHWTAGAHSTTVTYDQYPVESYRPYDYTYLGQLQISEDVPFQLIRTGLVLSDVGGPQGASLARVTRLGRVMRGAPGQVLGVRQVDSSDLMRRQTATPAFKAEDFAVGTQWAGVPSSLSLLMDAVESHQDIATITSATELTLSRSGLKGNWRLVDGKLRVDFARNSYLYTLLGKGAHGDARWLIQDLGADGSPQTAVEVSVIPVAIPTLDRAFWQHSFASNVTASYSPGTYYQPRSDGRFGLQYTEAGQPPTAFDFSRREWRLLADGRLEAVRSYEANCSIYQPLPGQGACTLWQQREWQPLLRVGDTVWVMQHGPVVFDTDGTASNADSWMLLALTLQAD